MSSGLLDVVVVLEVDDSAESVTRKSESPISMLGAVPSGDAGSCTLVDDTVLSVQMRPMFSVSFWIMSDHVAIVLGSTVFSSPNAAAGSASPMPSNCITAAPILSSGLAAALGTATPSERITPSSASANTLANPLGRRLGAFAINLEAPPPVPYSVFTHNANSPPIRTYKLKSSFQSRIKRPYRHHNSTRKARSVFAFPQVGYRF